MTTGNLPGTSGEFRVRLVPEVDLTADDDARIRALLVAAFPRHREIFTAASFWRARPEYRLWLEAPDGRMVAHLDFERRVVGVGDRDVLVAGVGEVATDPERWGRGLGRRLMRELQRIPRTEAPVPFGYLNCREAVAGFYERAGWHRLDRPGPYFEPDDREWVVNEGPKPILPALEPIATRPDGSIDLRGMPW